MWYHGSRWLFSKIERRHPVDLDGNPKEGGFKAVYITSDIGTALAFAARPEGVSNIDHEKRTIHFENPHLFEPEREIYIYHIDISSIPEERMILINKWQVAVFDEIIPVKVEKYKAGEVTKYYRIIGKILQVEHT